MCRPLLLSFTDPGGIGGKGRLAGEARWRQRFILLKQEHWPHSIFNPDSNWMETESHFLIKVCFEKYKTIKKTRVEVEVKEDGERRRPPNTTLPSPGVTTQKAFETDMILNQLCDR